MKFLFSILFIFMSIISNAQTSVLSQIRVKGNLYLEKLNPEDTFKVLIIKNGGIVDTIDASYITNNSDTSLVLNKNIFNYNGVADSFRFAKFPEGIFMGDSLYRYGLSLNKNVVNDTFAYREYALKTPGSIIGIGNGYPALNNKYTINIASVDSIILMQNLPISNKDDVDYVLTSKNLSYIGLENIEMLKRTPISEFNSGSGIDITASTGLLKIGNDIQMGGISNKSIEIDIDTNSFYIGNKGKFGFHLNSKLSDFNLNPEENEGIDKLTGFSFVDSSLNTFGLTGILSDNLSSQIGYAVLKGNPLPFDNMENTGQISVNTSSIDFDKLQEDGDTVIATSAFILEKDILNNRIFMNNSYKNSEINLESISNVLGYKQSEKTMSSNNISEKLFKSLGSDNFNDSIFQIYTLKDLDNSKIIISLLKDYPSNSSNNVYQELKLDTTGLYYGSTKSYNNNFNLSSTLIKTLDSLNIRSNIIQYKGTEVQEYAYIYLTPNLTMFKNDGYSTYYLEVNVGDSEYNIPHTITFPSNPISGMKKTIIIGTAAFGTLLTNDVTWDGNGSNLMFDEPTELKAGDTFIFQYFLENNTWVKLN